MSFTTRSYVVIPNGKLRLIGGQTLTDVIQGRKPYQESEVQGELRVIQLTCVKDKRKVTGINNAIGTLYKLLPTGFVDEDDLIRSIRAALHAEHAAKTVALLTDATQEDLAFVTAAETAAQAWSWTPTPEQMTQCHALLGLAA